MATKTTKQADVTDDLTGNQPEQIVPEVPEVPEKTPVTTVPNKEIERRAVYFLGPYHRYSRGDVATFDASTAESLVERGAAVWPGDAKKANSKKSGENTHDTDIG